MNSMLKQFEGILKEEKRLSGVDAEQLTRLPIRSLLYLLPKPATHKLTLFLLLLDSIAVSVFADILEFDRIKGK